MKKVTSKINVKFTGISNCVDGENAPTGACEKINNLREHLDALVAVGNCMPVGTLADGEQVVALHTTAASTKHIISTIGTTVCWHSTVAADGTISPKGITIANAANDITAVQSLGNWLIVATIGGTMLLRYDPATDSYSQLAIDNAIPRLILSTSGSYTMSATMPAYEFAVPLSQWQRPIDATDEEHITDLAADAYRQLRQRAITANYHLQPLLARYAVRLWNDSYLWVSPPVLLGNGIQPVASSTTATTSSNSFTGINAATVAVEAFRVGIVAESGNNDDWDGLVKAIDILVCDPIDPVDTATTINYTCSRNTTNSVVSYVMNFSLPTIDNNSLVAQLLAAKQWRIISSIYDLASLRQGVVNASNCQLATDAADLPTGVHRYEIIDAVTGSIDTSEIDRITASATRNYCHNALLVHNRRLFAAPSATLLRNPWHASIFWHGTLAATACRIVVEASINTATGTITTVWQGSSSLTPEALSPIISYPDSRATSITISILPSGGTMKRVTASLHSVSGCDMACCSTTDLQPMQFTDTGTSVMPIPQSSAAENTIGEIIEYEESNPLSIAKVHNVCDTSIHAIAATSHHMNNNIGTPLYIFADDGTYAMPYRVASGEYSPAVIISRKAITPQVRPVGSDTAVYFATSRGEICHISRYTVTTAARGIMTREMAWCCTHDELWIHTAEGNTLILMESGRMYNRNDADFTTLLHLSPTEAYAVDSNRTLLDITRENIGTAVAIDLLTCPIAIASCAATPRAVIWKLFADDIDLRLKVLGEHGASCHGMTLCSLSVRGTLAAPLPMHLIAPPVRTIRLAISGTLPAGTVLRPATVL